MKFLITQDKIVIFQNKHFELSNQIVISKRNFQNETFDC